MTPPDKSDSLRDLKQMSDTAWIAYNEQSNRLEPMRQHASSARRLFILAALREIQMGTPVLDVADEVVGDRSHSAVWALAEQIGAEVRAWVGDCGSRELRQ